MEAGLKVLFICCDGASPNRKFFRLHSPVGDMTLHKMESPFGTHSIHFISDPPHLLKTARNCFANSGAHASSRNLWFDGAISWEDIRRIFEEHCMGAYRLCPKLTPSHVYLTAFSRMKVNLAAQVLSSTVGNSICGL